MKAISHYCSQSWSEKELIIVPDVREKNWKWIAPYIKSLGRNDIRLDGNLEPLSLGSLRNRSIDLAEGEVICQWDDDDLYHPSRLEIQLNHMLANNAQASLFTDELQYFEDIDEWHWVNWVGNDDVPNTLMCMRSIMPRYEPELPQGEDRQVQYEIQRKYKTARLTGQGYLYTYVYHGKNFFNRDHHSWIANNLSYDYSFVKPRASLLAKHLSSYIPLPITITCRNGEKVYVG
jgi:glycosyltransferase involved in cell wall biosynthesis